jgi:cytosine permease
MKKAKEILYEFDREPVPQKNLYKAMYFASAYAGEHTAATEFVIGVLFITWGASVYDIFIGLLLGNLLAVLSWTFVCAPIAVRTRLTLYWFIHKIGGTKLAAFYNIFNALAYCTLAGTMITVSASAIRIPFGIAEQIYWFPTDIRFVILVLFVGLLITAIAILGFKKFAQFSSVVAPWMLIMFVAGALMALPVLAKESGIGSINSFASFWTMAKQFIWTGKAALADNQLGFFHVMAFAWICNLGMHLGLSDMAVFRFAKKAHYGLYSWTGMFLGHYVAWICAGILGAGAAIIANTSLNQMDSGAVGYTVLGICGAIAVVLAGLTTAIPTLYKSGLGLQTVTPDWPRWMVTGITGIITSIIACFPFVFAGMFNFIALYGLLLLPIGGIVFAEFWLFPKFGLTRYWVLHKRLTMNWPAFLTWLIMIIFVMYMWTTKLLHPFFQFIPIWILSIVLYIILSKKAGAKISGVKDEDVFQKPVYIESEPGSVRNTRWFSNYSSMEILTGTVSMLALLACLILPLIVLMSNPQNYDRMFVIMREWIILPTVIYFLAGSYWRIKRENKKVSVSYPDN